MSQLPRPTIALLLATLPIVLLACRLGTEPAPRPPFVATLTLPSGDSLTLRGTSADWRGVISPVGSGGRLRLVLRANRAPSDLGPPIDFIFYWSGTPVPLPATTYPLTDISFAGVLFQARAGVGIWVPDSGTVTILEADSLTFHGSFRARVRPVYSVYDSLPRLLLTGSFRAQRAVLPPRAAP